MVDGASPRGQAKAWAQGVWRGRCDVLWAARVQSATQQGGVPKRRCRQPGGHGGQEHAEATDGRLNRATRAVDSVAWMLCGGGMG